MRKFTRKAGSNLEEEVTIYGEDSWGRVAAQMRQRGRDVNPEECRRYWQDRKTRARRQQKIWTFRDNQDLAWLYEIHGENWCRYSENFPLFTRGEIRDHYNDTIRGNRERYLFFDEDGQPDTDQSPDYRMRLRDMYCPSGFWPETKQKFYHQWCQYEKKDEECPERLCFARNLYGAGRVACQDASFICQGCDEKLDANSLTIDHKCPVDLKLRSILRDRHKRSVPEIKDEMAEWYNDLNNLQPMCRRCNSSKGNRIP